MSRAGQRASVALGLLAGFAALALFGWVVGVERVLATVAFVAVPVADFLNLLPVPGGIGGVEVAMAGVLAALTPVDLAAAAVIAFCVRLCSYWFLLLLSGTATTFLSASGGPDAHRRSEAIWGDGNSPPTCTIWSTGSPPPAPGPGCC